MPDRLFLRFYDPPSALLASGSKKGVELGGSKVILSIDKDFNLYNEGLIYTEMSWAEFYQDIRGLEDQIDTFTTKEYKSIREDPEALVGEIITSLTHIIENDRLFYGIADFEVDAFMNQNTVIPGLKLDKDLINTLMEAHKKSRKKSRFPELIKEVEGEKFINITFQGTNKGKVQIQGEKIEDIADILRLAKGFATGLIISSKKSANFFIMNDRITFQEDQQPEFYIDEYGIKIIEHGIKRKRLFPTSWFRLDIGIRSLETLELWNQIEDNPSLQGALEGYNSYITELIVKKYKDDVDTKDKDSNFKEVFYGLNRIQQKKALNDMKKAIEKLEEMQQELEN
ncbi:MAG: hypothetical protein EU547_05120 [Promethearchaeota archaeon]|nr:MAG: hypothetical protein EU547_05120 [Candidatus Lokiarchaeota archaeon]